jgi:hypothetical protein
MTHTNTRLSLVALTAVAVVGCTILGPTTSDVPAEMIFCVDEINRYRTGDGLPALDRSTALETWATESARVDGTANRAHLHFTQTNGGGVALAETELLSWRSDDVHAIVRQGLQFMWNEGPDGEHRVILVGPYSEVGCGAFISGGLVTVVQSFR